MSWESVEKAISYQLMRETFFYLFLFLVLCAPLNNAFGQGPGACCLSDGSCIDLGYHQDCIDQGGIWSGYDTTCDAYRCSPLQSAYTEKDPIIDGSYYSYSNEWPSNTSAAALEISSPIHTRVYIKNNSNTLFLMVDAANAALGDYTDETDDHCSVALYKNGKGLRVLADGNGAEYCQRTTSMGSTSYMDQPGTPLLWDYISCPVGVEALDGFGFSPGAPSTNHRMYEFEIPLSEIGAEPGDIIYFASPFDVTNSLPYDYNNGDPERYNIWPPGPDGLGALPAWLYTWGQIKLASPVKPTVVPTMTEWGMIIFIVLAGLGTLYYLRKQRRAER